MPADHSDHGQHLNPSSNRQLQPEPRLLPFLPEEHELQPTLHLLHKLPDLGLCVVTQLTGLAVQQNGQHLSRHQGSGSQISVSHSTSVHDSWGSEGLAVGMARDLVGIGGIQSKETM